MTTQTKKPVTLIHMDNAGQLTRIIFTFGDTFIFGDILATLPQSRFSTISPKPYSTPTGKQQTTSGWKSLNGADRGNRTLLSSLEGYCITTMLCPRFALLCEITTAKLSLRQEIIYIIFILLCPWLYPREDRDRMLYYCFVCFYYFCFFSHTAYF